MRPLSLISMECLLEYMEANKRFELAQHCSLIRKLEKRIPLRIDFFQLGNCDIIINSTQYHLDIVQDCPHKTEFLTNPIIGIEHDLDQYCLPWNSPNMKVTPGDLVFKDEKYIWDRHRAAIISTRRCSLDMMEIELEKRTEKGGPKQLHPIFSSISTEELQENIENIKKMLKDIDTRADRHPCKRYLQLTIGPYCGPSWEELAQFRKSSQRVQRGIYNLPIGMAMKQLTTFLFGGRRRPIRVKTLTLGRDLYVLWLPEGLKLRIDTLNSGYAREVIKPILDESSYVDS